MTRCEQMLSDIGEEVALTRFLIGKPALDDRVMAAMRSVPRHEFVPNAMRRYAYVNGPLPIGEGQTISQPYVVALMTDLLASAADDRILEVGTGSGYQAAVLSCLVRQVYSLELIDSLSKRAAATLRRLGYRNVACRVGDGYGGWPDQAPFDGIIVTAAAVQIPPILVEQLKPGARLVIPVGLGYGPQVLTLVEKGASGEISTRNVLEVAFVPLVHGRTDRAAGSMED